MGVLRASSDEAHAVLWSGFRTHHNRLIDRILDDSRTRVRIAGPDHLVIHGFLVYRPPAMLHMCFVRKVHRRQGIARLLLSGIELEGATCTHWTRDLGRWILERSKRQVGRDKYGAPVCEFGLDYDPYSYLSEDA